MKTIICRYLPLAALLLLAAGCVDIDYVGQTFDPIPEGTPVEYFADRKEIPTGKYRIIGRAIIHTTWRFDKYDIRELLLDEARKRGADAVVLADSKEIRRGVYERDQNLDGGDIAPATRVGTIYPDGEQKFISLDRSAPLQGEPHYRIELELRVLFLKDREDLEQLLARRGRELDRLVKQPEPSQKDQEKSAGPAKSAEPEKPAKAH